MEEKNTPQKVPPHHKINSPIFNKEKISKWLHSHPNSVHFDKGEVLPHHRLMNMKRWVKPIQKKQSKVSVDYEPYN